MGSLRRTNIRQYRSVKSLPHTVEDHGVKRPRGWLLVALGATILLAILYAAVPPMLQFISDRRAAAAAATVASLQTRLDSLDRPPGLTDCNVVGDTSQVASRCWAGTGDPGQIVATVRNALVNDGMEMRDGGCKTVQSQAFEDEPPVSSCEAFLVTPDHFIIAVEAVVVASPSQTASDAPTEVTLGAYTAGNPPIRGVTIDPPPITRSASPLPN